MLIFAHGDRGPWAAGMLTELLRHLLGEALSHQVLRSSFPSYSVSHFLVSFFHASFSRYLLTSLSLLLHSTLPQGLNCCIPGYIVQCFARRRYSIIFGWINCQERPGLVDVLTLHVFLFPRSYWCLVDAGSFTGCPALLLPCRWHLCATAVSP